MIKNQESLAGAATDPEGPTGRMATWLARLSLNDVPQKVRERAKYLTLDGLACAIVGAKLPWSRTAVEVVTRLEGQGERTVIGWGLKTAAPAASLLNGTFIQGFELDDFHPVAPLHSASVVVPSLLACSEEVGGVSGAQFLKGAIAGYEVGPRVGYALHGGEMLSRGWHSGSVFGTHASAAAAGTLLELDAAKFEDALGLAGTQSCGLMAAQFESMSKRMHHGFSSRNGLYAAFLAAGGFTGIKRVFERPYGGFLSTFGEGHSPVASRISATLGKKWETENIIIKPYAVMGGLIGPLDCLFEISAQRPLQADEIESIDIDLAKTVFHHGWWVAERPLTPIGAQMNVAYALTVAILDGAALIEQFSPHRINRDDIWALLPKIVAHHNPEYDAPGARSGGRSHLRIKFRDGSSLESDRRSARSFEKPLTNQEIVEKYRALTNGLIDQSRQTEIERKIANLEELGDVRELIDLLAAPVGSAFE
jgi:aconitate decarboxylase